MIDLANAALNLLDDARIKVEKRDHPALIALDIADAMLIPARPQECRKKR